jgi:hypothetical protein
MPRLASRSCYCHFWDAGWGHARTCPQIQAVAVAPAPVVEQQSYEAPKSLHGFELVRDQFVAEYDSRVLTYRHQKTGEHSVRTRAVALWMRGSSTMGRLIMWRQLMWRR